MGVKYLNEIKKEHKLSNEKIAKASGVPRGTVNKIFAGISENPSFASIKAICEAMGADISLYAAPDEAIDQIISEKEGKELSKSVSVQLQEYDVVCLYRQLDTVGKSLVSRYMTDLMEMQSKVKN